MKYADAKISQRLIAYILDTLCVGIVAILLICLIPAFNQHVNHIVEFYEERFFENIEPTSDIFLSFLICLGIAYAVHIPLYTIYFVLLPSFWKKQTLGRFLMGVQVVTKAETKAKITNLLARELVGAILLNLLSGGMLLLLIYWYLCMSTGRSLADMAGGTRLIDSKRMNSDYVENDKKTTFDGDYVDATFTEVKENKDDIDYKVF
ncbi:MAG: RDD family protein [Anaeroplasmataceae bacterium]|nr:RDD family protein [Anaeroplasmataceae bacterium]